MVQVDNPPQIQKIVSGMCLVIWSYQASVFSGFLKIKDTDTLLYKQYVSLKKRSSLVGTHAFAVAGMTASLAGILVAVSLGEFSFSNNASKFGWKLS